MEAQIRNLVLNLEKPLQQELISCSVKTFLKGDVVIKQNSYVKNLPFLVYGGLRVFKQIEDRQILFYHLQKGEVCGLALGACMENKITKSEITAVEESLVLLIPASKILEWQKTYVSWNHFIIKIFTQRQQQLLDNYGEVAFSKMEKRIKDYFCYLIKESSESSIHITHQELANELGTTRVVISRILKNLEMGGVLELVRGAVKIKKLSCSYSHS